MYVVSDESISGGIKVVGVLSVADDEALTLETEIIELRFKHCYFEEIKWNVFSRESIPFYHDLIQIFFKFKSARFHSNSFLSESDQYRVSFRLLENLSWKLSSAKIFEKFTVIFDHTQKGREEIILSKDYLSKSKRFHHSIALFTEANSKCLNLIQLCDLFCGSLAHKINCKINVKYKKANSHIGKTKLIEEIETLDSGLELDLASTNPYQLWYYYEKKIQHYNLHLRKPSINMMVQILK